MNDKASQSSVDSSTGSSGAGGLGPIACTLTTKEAASQSREWRDLQLQVLEVTKVEGGTRMVLPAELESVAADLAARERQCCSFLDITTSVEAGDAGGLNPESSRLIIEVTSQHPDAGPVIALLVGDQPGGGGAAGTTATQEGAAGVETSDGGCGSCC